MVDVTAPLWILTRSRQWRVACRSERDRNGRMHWRIKCFSPNVGHAMRQELEQTGVKPILTVICVYVTSICGSATVTAQEIRGRVVDEENRRAVAGALVTLTAADSTPVFRTGTDEDGFFVVIAGRPGRFELSVSSIGFGTETRVVNVEASHITVPAFVLKVTAIPLAPVVTDASRRGRVDSLAGFSRSRFLLTGSRLQTLEEHGLPFKQAVLDLGGSLRMREGYIAGRYYLCIETKRGMASFRGVNGCAWPAIIIDDIEIRGDMQAIVRALSIADMESIEFVPPVEAGRRYGLNASPNGALVIWTRGQGPHRSSARGKQ